MFKELGIQTTKRERLEFKPAKFKTSSQVMSSLKEKKEHKKKKKKKKQNKKRRIRFENKFKIF